jgi:hypothetical protein
MTREQATTHGDIREIAHVEGLRLALARLRHGLA